MPVVLDLEIELLGFLIQQQKRTCLGLHDSGAGMQNQFEELVRSCTEETQLEIFFS